MQIIPMENPQQKNKMDQAIEWLLYALLAFMPFAHGAVDAWSEEVVIIFSVALMGCLTVKLVLDRQFKFVWTWGYIPIAFFIFIVVFQLVPLSVEFVNTISPNTVKLKTELFGYLPNSESLLSSMSLTFYRHATVRQLRLLLALVSIFIVVVSYFNSSEKVKRLLFAIALIGGCVSLLAIAQVITSSDKIYWLIKIPHEIADAGPFVNHSNFAQFINLSMGAAFGLLFVVLHEFFSGKKFSAELLGGFFDSDFGKRSGLLLLIIILGMTSIFVSLSRGGMVSMLIAMSFTILLLTERNTVRGRGWLMVVMALAAFICVLYVGFDAVYDRLATLRDLHGVQAGRLQILKDIALAWTKFPLFGTGLGTHEVVYPMFDRSTIAAIAGHAENEYAQTVEETGVLGLLSLLLFGGIVFVNFKKCIQSAARPIRSVAYGFGFALLAILMHSLSDFGQHLPANASLTIIFCGLLISLARETDSDKQLASKRFLLANLLGIGLVISLIAALALLTFYPGGGNDARVAESYWRTVYRAESALMDKGWQGSDEEYNEILNYATLASDLQPTNASYRHWLNVYRWHSISRARDPENGSPVIFEESLVYVPRIIDEFYKAIAMCPTFGPSWCLAGQLKQLAEGESSSLGETLIKKGYELAPGNPTVCFVAGNIDAGNAIAGAADSGDPTDPKVVSVSDSPELLAAVEKLNRSVELDSRFFKQVCDIYVSQLNRPDLAADLASNDIGRLYHVVKLFDGFSEHDQLADEYRLTLFELLKARSQEPDAPAWIFASIANYYSKQEAYTGSIDNYRRALILDYGQVGWRLTLARLLAKTDQIPEAIHEAKICLRLDPQQKGAKKLIEDLSVLPGALR